MRCWDVSVVALLPLLLTALAAECPGKENTNKPWVGTPTLLQKVANGSLFTAGDGDDQLFGEDNPHQFSISQIVGLPITLSRFLEFSSFPQSRILIFAVRLSCSLKTST